MTEYKSQWVLIEIIQMTLSIAKNSSDISYETSAVAYQDSEPGPSYQSEMSLCIKLNISSNVWRWSDRSRLYIIRSAAPR